MDVHATAGLAAPVPTVFAAVADLATYTHWLGIVLAVEPVADDRWWVDIGARLGPLRKAKRLTMHRTEYDAPRRTMFVRDERDGRSHSPWVLRAQVAPAEAAPAGTGPATSLTMHLHYGGSMTVPLLDRVLAIEVQKAPGRLDRYLARS